MPAKKTRARGFSLIELIVIIVIAGFLALLVISLMGWQLTKSGKAVQGTQYAGTAEANMEAVVAYYTNRVNANLATALTDVQNNFSGNSTVSFTSTTISSVPAVIVTVTVGDTVLVNVLTQERTNSADAAVYY